LDYLSTYEKVAERMNKIPNFLVAKIDMSFNEVDGLVLKNYPHMKFYPANKKNNPVFVSTKQGEDSLIKFVKGKLSQPFNDDL